MKFNLLISSFVLSAAFLASTLAHGGNDPIGGVDIIIKRSALCHPHCDTAAPIVAPAADSGNIADDQNSQLISSKKESGAIQDKSRPLGGDDPIKGVDISIKQSALCHPHCD